MSVALLPLETIEGMYFRSRDDGESYPIGEGDSMLDAEIERVQNEPERPNPNVCQYCGSGGCSTLAFPTTGLRACETCFAREFNKLSIEEQEAVLRAAELEAGISPTVPNAPTIQARPTTPSSKVDKGGRTVPGQCAMCGKSVYVCRSHNVCYSDGHGSRCGSG